MIISCCYNANKQTTTQTNKQINKYKIHCRTYLFKNTAWDTVKKHQFRCVTRLLCQVATNALSDCQGQFKIPLGNQKFKVLCPDGQLKFKQETERKLKFCYYFWHFNRCVWHFIPYQVEGDSFNLICKQCVPKLGCCKVLQTIFPQHQILVQKLGMIRQLIYNVRLPHGATSSEKFVVACSVL